MFNYVTAIQTLSANSGKASYNKVCIQTDTDLIPIRGLAKNVSNSGETTIWASLSTGQSLTILDSYSLIIKS